MKIKIKQLFLFMLFGLFNPILLNAEELVITSFGYSNFLLQGGGLNIQLNPFKATGCNQNLKEVNDIDVDFIIASSRLDDEGYNPANKLMFFNPGIFKVKNIILSGISVPHDRLNGRRFGFGTVWNWDQNDFKIVHMAGAAGKISIEDEILLSRPDILFISVGGGLKSYNGLEASKIVLRLQPKIVIPVHYSKEANLIENCDLSTKNEFLKNMSDYNIRYVGNSFEFNKRNLIERSIYIFE